MRRKLLKHARISIGEEQPRMSLEDCNIIDSHSKAWTLDLWNTALFVASLRADRMMIWNSDAAIIAPGGCCRIARLHRAQTSTGMFNSALMVRRKVALHARTG